MSVKRGALIVFEGCDRSGKTTQVNRLVNVLSHTMPVVLQNFPNRETPIGTLINGYLSNQYCFPAEVVHLLFSANRWEFKEDIRKTLLAGTTIIMDRYTASGAAYAAANTGRDLSWCRQPDIGLPKPDCVFFLKISKGGQEQRSNWGIEKFERKEIQTRVEANFEKLQDDNWIIMDGEQDVTTLHNEIKQKVLSVIEKIKHCDIELIGS